MLRVHDSQFDGLTVKGFCLEGSGREGVVGLGFGVWGFGFGV